MSLNQRKAKIVGDFQTLASWEDRYQKIIEMGKNLPPMPDDQKIEANKVKGCQSQLWLSAETREGKIYFHADSDAAISKGIVALLIALYSDATPGDILGLGQDFVDEMELRQHLSMSRANGLASVLKQIQFYALAFQAKQGDMLCP